MVKEIEMKDVIEKAQALYDVLVKKIAENAALSEKLYSTEAELDGKLADIKEIMQELDEREKKVKSVEDVIALAEDAKTARIAADIILSDAKKTLLKAEDKDRAVAINESALLAKVKNLESQQKSLNDEAARLEKDRKEMKEKILSKLAKGV